MTSSKTPNEKKISVFLKKHNFLQMFAVHLGKAQLVGSALNTVWIYGLFFKQNRCLWEKQSFWWFAFRMFIMERYWRKKRKKSRKRKRKICGPNFFLFSIRPQLTRPPPELPKTFCPFLSFHFVSSVSANVLLLYLLLFSISNCSFY